MILVGSSYQIMSMAPQEVYQHQLNRKLFNAIGQGNTDAIASLLKEGADANSVIGNTTLLKSAILRDIPSNNNREIVELLIQAGADVNNVGTSGTAPLLDAAFKGYTDVVKLLIDNGADINHVNKIDRTPLMEATIRGHTDIVRLLVEHGARLPDNPQLIQRIRNQLEETIGNAFILDVILGNTDHVSQLLEQAPTEPPRKKAKYEGSQPSHISAYFVGLRDNFGMTALHWAAARGNDALVRLLLDHGFGINARDANGNTPLHLAARNGNLSVVKLLLARDANPNLINQNGDLPIALAYRYHRADVIAFLEREAGRTVFGRLSRAGTMGQLAWQHPSGFTIPPELAYLIAQFALAPGRIPPAGSSS